MNKGKFYGVGVGPGDPRLLTLRAVEVLQSVDIVAIPKSRHDRESVAWEIARRHYRAQTELLELEMPMTSDQGILQQAWQTGAQTILSRLNSGLNVAFITIGDPSLYSTYSYLLTYLRPHLSPKQIETVPGISAMSAAAARINVPLALGDEPLLVLPGTDDIGRFLDLPNLVILKVSRNLPDVAQSLTGSEREAVLFTRIGQDGEEIRALNELAETEKVDYLSLLLIKMGGKQ